uniref:Unspecific monooxygenase n=1 Tax=Steinernema glaseri TaxID=37863 RepID=A0A1I7ZSE4_9BILA
MQYRILEEAFHRFDILDEQIHRTGGKVTIDPTPMLDLMIGSIINVLLAGYRYDEDSTEYMALKHSLDQSMDIITPLDQILFNEYTYQLPLLRKRWSVLVQPQTDIITLMRRQVRDRKAEIAKGEHHLDLSGTGDDFIDAYLIEMKKREMAGEELGAFNEENLCATLLDLWVAGTETTISTLLWVFIYLANRSTVQDKLRAELIAVTKGNRRVELADKTSLPFTCAVVTEALRCGNIVNFNVFHQTTCETQVGDYMLPAGTVITPQVSVITMDEGAFINPHDFDPDRYINDKNLEKQVIPFSLGKRSCLGESLARAEMFLILANFVQKYKILPPTGSGPLSEEQQSLTSMLRRSRKYQILVEPVH